MKPFQETERFTRFHNYLLDEVMPIVKPNAWKVLCCIIRCTAGWQMKDGTRKLTDKISYSQLRERTGIKNRSTIHDAIMELVSLNLITFTPGNENESNEYGLNWDYEVPSLEIGLPLQPSPKIGLAPSPKNGLPPSPKIGHTKERTSKEKGKEKDVPANGTRAATPPLTKAPSTHQAIIDAYVSELGHTPPNMGREGKAAKWLVQHDYSPEQVLACYRHMKADKFWSDKFLSLQKVSEQIAEYTRAAAPRYTMTPSGARMTS